MMNMSQADSSKKKGPGPLILGILAAAGLFLLYLVVNAFGKTKRTEARTQARVDKAAIRVGGRTDRSANRQSGRTDRKTVRKQYSRRALRSDRKTLKLNNRQERKMSRRRK